MHKQKLQAIERRISYYASPAKCLECDASIAYENKSGKFCSSSCSAKNSNKKRVQDGYTISLSHREKIRSTLLGRQGHSKNKGKIRVPRINRECIDCHRMMTVRETDLRKYCSKACRSKHLGGYREGSGYSKSGYYNNIYCGSTYELVWVIYRLDHGLPVNRFPGFIWYNQTRKYYPDFIEGTHIYEMKGWLGTADNTNVIAKTEAAIANGYTIDVLFKDNLINEFLWVKNNYVYNKLYDLYDVSKPKRAVKKHKGATVG